MSAIPQVLKIPALEAEPGLVHGFSTTSLGSMGLTQAPDPDVVMASRRHFARVLGIDAEPLTVAGAVHGAAVARVDEHKDVIRGVDALVTNRRGVALFATYADCYPILLWDPEHRCAALAHAGWRGTLARVGPAALKAMRDEYATNPARVKAGIGPGICGRCYEVGEDVAGQFDAAFTRAGDGGRYLLDLAAANKAQLEAEGVADVNMIGVCTKETEYLPSHRRSPDGTRFAAIVAIR
ncbi:MAG TPA: polyphenol oxidase family protein [Candidatus Dormibacteraeota bacterium]|nr:polyphenol oxidase family protein [Candidatus Dormibacteraeota bacterium]